MFVYLSGQIRTYVGIRGNTGITKCIKTYSEFVLFPILKPSEGEKQNKPPTIHMIKQYSGNYSNILIIKIKIHSSCEIEDFVETHLCKLCVILRSRELRVVCPH